MSRTDHANSKELRGQILMMNWNRIEKGRNDWESPWGGTIKKGGALNS
jgi:hypothetical protein